MRTITNPSSRPPRRGKLKLALAAAAVALCALAVPALGGGRQPLAVIAKGGALVIKTAEITGTATFYPVQVNGTTMEVLAVRDDAGRIRTAFNTCQVCYTSGRGYFVQAGNALVCQNCQNAFTVDQVEVESGGCNPWPIFPQDKTETADEIRISYDFLAKSQRIFAKWKKKK